MNLSRIQSVLVAVISVITFLPSGAVAKDHTDQSTTHEQCTLKDSKVGAGDGFWFGNIDDGSYSKEVNYDNLYPDGPSDCEGRARMSGVARLEYWTNQGYWLIAGGKITGWVMVTDYDYTAFTARTALALCNKRNIEDCTGTGDWEYVDICGNGEWKRDTNAKIECGKLPAKLNNKDETGSTSTGGTSTGGTSTGGVTTNLDTSTNNEQASDDTAAGTGNLNKVERSANGAASDQTLPEWTIAAQETGNFEEIPDSDANGPEMWMMGVAIGGFVVIVFIAVAVALLKWRTNKSMAKEAETEMTKEVTASKVVHVADESVEEVTGKEVVVETGKVEVVTEVVAV